MKPEILLLTASAVCEAFWNIALKKSTGITNWRVNLVGIICLILGIITFKKSIETIPLSVAIVIWSGFSLMLTIGLDMILYKSKIDLKTGFFMLLCLISIIGLNYFSAKYNNSI